MKCKHDDTEMDSFIWDEIGDYAIYECPLCDYTFMTDSCKKYIKQVLDSMNIKENTKEFDKQLKQFSDDIKRQRQYNTTLASGGVVFVEEVNSNDHQDE